MSRKQFHRILMILLAAQASVALAQDSALVLLRPAGVEKGACKTGVEPSIVTIRDFKINGKTDLRMANGITAAPGTSLSKQQFDRLRKAKLKDLSQIDVRDGLLFAATGDSPKTLAIPDVEPAKNSSMQLAQYSSMQLEGELQEGKNKQKKIIPLATIWRIFILGRTMTQDEALFRHARDEASVSQWAFYTSKVSSYRMQEAAVGMTQATNGCLDRAMKRFRDGEFGAINEAREMAQQAVSMSGNDPAAAARLADIRKEEQNVKSSIDRGSELEKAHKWDDALDIWKSVSAFRKDTTLKQFDEAYTRALAGSHDFHVIKAKEALSNRGPNPEPAYQAAKAEYEVALTRIPNSPEATKGKRDAKIDIALLQADRSRQAKEPGKAHDILEAIIKDVGDDERIAPVLKEVNCEYATQSYEQSRTLVTVTVAAPAPAPPAGRGGRAPAAGGRGAGTSGNGPGRGGRAAVAPAAQPEPAAPKAASYKVNQVRTIDGKKPFLDARGKLATAIGLCPATAIDKIRLLAEVNGSLADFHVAQANQAIKRKLEATALLNLQAAQTFQADRGDLEGLLALVHDPVQNKARLQVGVVMTATGECGEFAPQISSSVESALVSGAGANVQLMDHAQAAQRLQTARSAAASNVTGNFAIVSGTLSACTFNATHVRQSIPSKYPVENPDYGNVQNAIRQLDRDVDQCKAQHPQTEKNDCAALRNQRSGLQDRLGRMQRYNQVTYNYEEITHAATGQMQLTMNVYDSILRATRPAGTASAPLSENCVERNGFRQDDSEHRGIDNAACEPMERATKMPLMAGSIASQAEAQGAAAIRGVAKSYLEVAKRATDQDTALENYILFTLLSSEKNSAEYQQAVAAVRARDADLKPETALR
jgi:tetratricopeptide (TPR) repeat protein